MECGECSRFYHQECLPLTAQTDPHLPPSPDSPWLCTLCLKQTLLSTQAGKETPTPGTGELTPTSKGRAGRQGRKAGGAPKTPSRSNSMDLAPPPSASSANHASSSASGSASPSPCPSAASPKATPPLSEQALCQLMMTEIDNHKCSWPFKVPVDVKVFPLYKKVIKHPIDLSVVTNNLQLNTYKSAKEFAEDIQLIFSNCKTFNEDDSPVGKAGHTLRRFFNRRWRELTTNGPPKPRLTRKLKDTSGGTKPTPSDNHSKS